jgi:TPR repeat protein
MEIGQSNAAWMLDRGFAHAGHQAASVATALFKRSAEQGNVMSLLQLGDCYYYGSGVEQVCCAVLSLLPLYLTTRLGGSRVWLESRRGVMLGVWLLCAVPCCCLSARSPRLASKSAC